MARMPRAMYCDIPFCAFFPGKLASLDAALKMVPDTGADASTISKLGGEKALFEQKQSVNKGGFAQTFLDLARLIGPQFF